MIGTSIRTSRSATPSGATSADTPRIPSTLNTFDPTTLPRARSALPVSEAPRLAAISGALVPNATTVSPMTSGDTPAAAASRLAPRTSSSAPATSVSNPAMRRIEVVTSPRLPPGW